MNVHQKLYYIMENIVGFKYFAEFNGSVELDCTSLEDYGKLSADNFLLFPKKVNLSLIQNYNNLGKGSGSSTTDLYTIYDAVQGKLNIHANFSVNQSNAGGFNVTSGTLQGYVYIIPSNIFIN